MTIPEDCAIKEEKESDIELLTRRQRYLILLLSHFWCKGAHKLSWWKIDGDKQTSPEAISIGGSSRD